MSNEKMPEASAQPEGAVVESPRANLADKTREKVASATQFGKEILRPKDFMNEVLTPREMTPQKVQEISDFFRWIFNNDWNQYAVCAPCEEKTGKEVRMSAPQAFGTKEHLPLEVLDDPKNLPCCPDCAKPMQWFHDPEKTRQNIQRKLLDLGDGYASLIRHLSDGKVAGFAFGYGATLREEYEVEWQNRYLYMKEPPHKAGRDFDALLEALNHAFPKVPFGADTKVFAWNCVALAPQARFGKLLGGMMHSFFNSVPIESRNRMVVGEAIKGSTANGYFKSIGAIEVEGFIEGAETLMAGHLGEMVSKVIERSSTPGQK